jgi:hypothetical protein
MSEAALQIPSINRPARRDRRRVGRPAPRPPRSRLQRRIVILRATTFALGLSLLLSFTLRSADWPQFRGPFGNGISPENKAPLHWGPAKNVRWKEALPGPGNSSPIVSRGRVFITCAEDGGKRRHLYCFDRRDGAQLWIRTATFPVV